MIDFEVLNQTLIDIVREGVGPRLATIANGTLPAVIKSREKGTPPAYPNVQLDVVGIRPIDGSQPIATIDRDTGELVYLTTYGIMYSFIVYGDKYGAIAQELSAYLTREQQSTCKLEQEANAVVIDILPITFSHRKGDADRWLDISKFDVFLHIVDMKSTAADGTFSTVNIDGDVTTPESEDITFSVGFTGSPD